jgi:type IV pilus assembly protein PilO
MKLSKREIILLIFLLGAVAIGGYYKFLMSPLLENLSAQREVFQQNQDELQILKAKQASLTKLTKEVEELEASKDELIKKLPPYLSLAQIIVELDALSTKAGGTVKNLSFVVGSPSTEYSVLAIPVSWSGTYNQLMAFLDAVEQSERKLMVENISMSSDDGAGLEASFTIATFASATGDGVYKNPDKTVDYDNIKVNVFSVSQGELFNTTTGSSEHYGMIKDIINKYLKGNN